MRDIKLRFIGTSPLLLSSDRLSDPLDPKTVEHKALTSKRKKTNEDHLAIARSQWEGLLYLDDKNNIIMPMQNIRAAILSGAKLNKLGMQIKRGTVMFGEHVLIDYGAKLTIDELWDQCYRDKRSVVVSNARIIAYRPRFEKWKFEFTLAYDEKTLDENNIIQSAQNAGQYTGIGGFRPEKGGSFGRFNVEKVV